MCLKTYDLLMVFSSGPLSCSSLYTSVEIFSDLQKESLFDSHKKHTTWKYLLKFMQILVH